MTHLSPWIHLRMLCAPLHSRRFCLNLYHWLILISIARLTARCCFKGQTHFSKWTPFPEKRMWSIYCSTMQCVADCFIIMLNFSKKLIDLKYLLLYYAQCNHLFENTALWRKLKKRCYFWHQFDLVMYVTTNAYRVRPLITLEKQGSKSSYSKLPK